MSEIKEKNAGEVMPPLRRRRAFIIFGGWTLFGLFFACQSYIANSYFDRHAPFGRILVPWLSLAYVWALLTPLAMKLARRFPLERGKLFRGVLLHSLVGILFSLLQVAVYLVAYVFSREWVMGNSPPAYVLLRSYQSLLVAEFHFNLFVYWVLLGLYHAYNYYRRFREHERRAAHLQVQAAQLETQLAQAQLDALKMQLHPHFLFNTLNSISVLMHDDAKAANRMLVRLSELLRVALNSEGAQEIPLRQELQFLRGYLEIEQTRFQDRLTVDFNVAEETLDAQVPNLILQPIVENAIRHGIAPRAEAGLIQVQARRENGFIELCVRDNGAGLNQGGTHANGIGLANTRKRLEKLYGEEYGFEISSPATGGLRVEIRFPFHTNGDGE
jgi:two-component system LytT family sensor kinase